MKKLWAGRFKEETESSVESFTESVSFDARLWKHDILGSIAHVKMLAKQKIVSAKESAKIVKGLNEIMEEIKSGKFRFKESLEDVHMNIEHALIRKVGPVGGKLHSARSRNDQVALDLRLYLRDEIKEIIIGMPYAQDGSKGKKCEDVDRFIELLEDVVTLPITACDERFSTVAASRQLQSLGYNQKKQRGKIDSAAAAFMLQGYLDRKK